MTSHTRHRHINTPLLLLASFLGVTLFVFALTNPNLSSTRNSGQIVLSPPPQQHSADLSSTALSARFAETESDALCLNDLTLHTRSSAEDWDGARIFFSDFFGAYTENIEQELRALAPTPQRAIASICRHAEHLYILHRMNAGTELTSHTISRMQPASNELVSVTEFIVPESRSLAMYTNVFPDQSIAITAHEESEERTAWYYFKLNPSTDHFEQVEWCDYRQDEALFPSTEESGLICEYIYAF